MGGRPLMYKTAEELSAKIDEYFNDCEGVPVTDDDGRPQFTDRGVQLYSRPPRPPTVTGLAHFLGLKSRQALINYAGRGAFNDAVTRAKLRCEAYAEERLYDRDGQRGAEFSLRCNFHWDDHAAREGDDDKLDKILTQVRKNAEQ